MRVLLLDKPSPFRARLAEAITELPGVQLDVDQIGDGGTIAMTKGRSPDVVIVDMDDSRGRGLEAIRRLRSGADAHPVIVAMAGTGSIQYRVYCHDAGASFFFDRLRDQDWLLESLRRLREELDEQ